MDAKPIVRELVQHTVVDRAGSAAVADDHPLLDSGMLDSLGIFELVSELEARCGVTIEDDELVPEHFGSINDIAALVEHKSAV